MPSFNSLVYDMLAFFRPTVICGFCNARFRPSAMYKKMALPFGFDWIRNGDARSFVELDLPYKENIGEFTDTDRLPQYSKQGRSRAIANAQMYDMLCKSYLPGNLHLFPSENGKRKRYHVPVLSIYPYDDNPDNVAHIALVVEIKKEIRDIRLEYDSTVFEIEGMDGLQLAVGTQSCELSVKCLKEFDENKYVRLVATDRRGKTMNAGMMRVAPNAKSFRRSLDVLIVNVKHLSSAASDATVLAGNGESIKVDVYPILRQALVTPAFELVELDLQQDNEMIDRMRTVGGKKKIFAYAKQVHTKGAVGSGNNCKDLIEYLGEKLEQVANTQAYDIILFCIGCGIVKARDGEEETVGGYASGKCAILQKGFRKGTPSHELLHSLNLGHSFCDRLLDGQPSPYFYRKCTTDNIMDYTTIRRTTMWEWQWKLIRPKCKPEI